MVLKDLMKKSKKLEIQAYKKRIDPKELRKGYVPYTGSPTKHPFEHDKVILLIEPYSSSTSYYEFKTNDIFYVEELANISNIDGETVPMVRIWIQKGSIALRCSPFFVEDIKR